MRLKELEYLEKEPDGIFDEETEKALLEFQQDQGLLRSGMADQTTMQALEKATQKKTEKEPGHMMMQNTKQQRQCRGLRIS